MPRMLSTKRSGTWRWAGKLCCLALAATLALPPVALARDNQGEQGYESQGKPQESKGKRGEGHQQQQYQGKPSHNQKGAPQQYQGKPGYKQKGAPQQYQGKPGYNPNQKYPQGHNYQRPPQNKRYKSYYGNHPRVVPNLPPKHTTYVYKGDRYYYYGGRYYRPYRSGGYVVVRPPVGFYVPILPLGFITLLIAGITYYTFAGIYYRASSGGYVVVDAPAGAVVNSPAAPAIGAPSAPIGQAVVMAPLLNVRSGPGMNYPVVTTVMQGYSINVYGSAPDWLYVQAPNGQFGWVAQGYTNYNPGPVPSG
jgi:hypothetical protein